MQERTEKSQVSGLRSSPGWGKLLIIKAEATELYQYQPIKKLDLVLKKYSTIAFLRVWDMILMRKLHGKNEKGGGGANRFVKVDRSACPPQVYVPFHASHLNIKAQEDLP